MSIDQRAQEEFDAVFVRLVESADDPSGVLSLALMRVVEVYLQFGRSFEDIDRMLMEFTSKMRSDPRFQTP